MFIFFVQQTYLHDLWTIIAINTYAIQNYKPHWNRECAFVWKISGSPLLRCTVCTWPHAGRACPICLSSLGTPGRWPSALRRSPLAGTAAGTHRGRSARPCWSSALLEKREDETIVRKQQNEMYVRIHNNNRDKRSDDCKVLMQYCN